MVAAMMAAAVYGRPIDPGWFRLPQPAWHARRWWEGVRALVERLIVKAVALDGSVTANSVGAVSTWSFSHTNGSASDLLVIAIATATALGVVHGVTYNGVALSQRVVQPSAAGPRRSEIWTLSSPATGSNTISIDLNSQAIVRGEAVAYSFSGAVYLGGTSGSGSGANPSTAITTKAAGLAVDAVADVSPVTVGAGQTQGGNSTTGEASSYKAATTTSTTMQWTAGAADWSQSVIALDPTATSRSVTRTGTHAYTFARKGSPFTRGLTRSGAMTLVFVLLGTFKRTLSRTGSALATFVRHTTFARGLTRSGAMTLAFLRKGNPFKRTLFRTGAMTLAFTRHVIFARPLARTSTLIAAFKRRGFPFNRTSSRSGPMTLAFVRGKLLIRSLTRTGAMTLAFNVGHVYIRALTRAGAMTLSFARAGTFKRTAARAGAMTLAFFGRGSFNRTSARSGSMTLSFVRHGIPFVRSIARAGVVAAAFARQGNPFKRAISRTGAQTLGFARTYATSRTSSRSGSMSLAFARAGSTYRRRLARAGAMTASFARALTARRTLTRSGSMTLVFRSVRIFPRTLLRAGNMTLVFARKGNPFKRSINRAGAMNMSAVAARAVNMFKTLSRAGAMLLRFLFQVGRPRPRGIFFDGETRQLILVAESERVILEGAVSDPVLFSAEMEES